MKALLLSGGMDSIALAYWKRPDIALTVDYGQAAAGAEIRAASAVAAELGLRHRVISVDCHHLGRGEMAGKEAIKGAPTPEWWPFRNQLLITLGAMYLAGSDVDELMIGTVADDHPHADGRKEFITTISELVGRQEFGVRVSAPALDMTTVELVRLSQIPHEVLAWAHSCHALTAACGTCRGCNKHRAVYEALGMHAY